MGEEWYFFCHKDRKYPTGTRTNRATESGYWKATGKDKKIFRGRGILVGMKMTLVFYRDRGPRGNKTGWVMHEFRLEGKLPHPLPHSAKDEWAVCKVFNKDLAAESSYWKATGKDKKIFRGRGILVGMKMTLVFYRDRGPRGDKTGWVMHEFRLEGKLPHPLPHSAKDEWAVCKVFNKDLAARNGPMAAAGVGLERVSSFGFISDFLDSAELPPLMDPPFGADVDEVIDFKGPASTSGHAAVASAHAALMFDEMHLG